MWDMGVEVSVMRWDVAVGSTNVGGLNLLSDAELRGEPGGSW